MEIIKSIQSEWPAISAAPWSVAIMAVIAFSVGFLASRLRMNAELRGKTATIEFLKYQLGARSIREILNKIAAMESRIRELEEKPKFPGLLAQMQQGIHSKFCRKSTC